MRLAPLGWLTTLGDRGNVAIMTAVVLPLLLLVGGFAVDYGYASYLNQRLTQATDNAVLASVSQSAATAGGGFGNTAWLQNYGTRVFKSNLADLPISNVQFSLTVSPNGSLGVNSQGSYNYNYPTFFSGVLGISQIPLSNQIKASANPITYIDYYVVVDVSQSMGIASTTDDMNALWSRIIQYHNQSNSEPSCVFGCHVLQGPQQHTNEELAHSSQFGPRINLRIDAAVSAIQSIIADAQSASGTNKNIRIGLYTMSRDPNHPGIYVNVVSPPSSDYATLISQASAIDLGGNNSGGSGDSDFQNGIQSFNSMLPVNGSGASAVAPKNFVFLVTDGISDVPGSCTYGHCTAALDPGLCSPVKLKATMGVIYTTYITIYDNNVVGGNLEDAYQKLVAPNINQVAPNLQTCSSDASKYYFEAKDGPGINSAMRALFASTLQNARLTQ